jgi:hypothetical protein
VAVPRPCAGAPTAAIRPVRVVGGGRNERLFVYYGKPNATASEATPTQVWRGYLAVFDARTGADRSGRARDLMPTNVGAGELLAWRGRL